MKEDGPHVPGPNADAVRFLVEERDVNGWGVEAVGTDAGQAFSFEPRFPGPCADARRRTSSASRAYAISTSCPPTGAVIIAAPLKIENGSGSPLRVLALVHEDDTD